MSRVSEKLTAFSVLLEDFFRRFESRRFVILEEMGFVHDGNLEAFLLQLKLLFGQEIVRYDDDLAVA